MSNAWRRDWAEWGKGGKEKYGYSCQGYAFWAMFHYANELYGAKWLDMPSYELNKPRDWWQRRKNVGPRSAACITDFAFWALHDKPFSRQGLAADDVIKSFEELIT